MAAKSNLTNMALVLTAVCLVCAAILGVVYVVTAEPIAAAAAAEAQASIAKVLPEGGEISEELSSDAEGVDGYFVQTDGEGAVTAFAVKSTTGGFGGPVTLMVGVLPDGTVFNTSVLSHSETPGLGAKCTEENSHFREQWKGFTGKLAVTKDGGDIDAITASTITSRAYTKAVAQAVALVRNLSSATGKGQACVPQGDDSACIACPMATDKTKEE